MKIEEVRFNAGNWVDGKQTLRYCELKDGRVKFDYRGESWVMSPIIREDVGLESDFLECKVFQKNLGYESDYPTVKLMKYDRDPEWLATDGDYINGINREHTNRVIAACQILGNII
jgi:hypothetical protein